jgi:hypothetical protein
MGRHADSLIADIWTGKRIQLIDHDDHQAAED